MNDFRFGDKLKMSDGEMGIYVGWHFPISLTDGRQCKDKLHNIIMKHKTSFCIVQVYDYGRLHGDIHVVGKWEEDRKMMKTIEKEPVTSGAGRTFQTCGPKERRTSNEC